jgi:hypothetical protein
MSEPTREREISVSPVSRWRVSLKSASLLPGLVQCAVLFFSRSASLLWLDVVVFAQTLKIAFTTESAAALEKNEHCTRPGQAWSRG